MSHISDDCRSFYELRDRRSVEYLARNIDRLRPVHLVIGPSTATSAAGQFALLALANQVVRTSRRVSFQFPDIAIPLIASSFFGHATLDDEVLAMARAIDPCGDFVAGAPAEQAISIGVGVPTTGLDWYIGADRSVASIDRNPLPLGDSPGSMRGAALASCLGAAAVLREQLGLGSSPRRISAWNFAEGSNADAGPDSLESLDIGRVLMVGAGAVGAAVAYWLHEFGVAGSDWVVVDGDLVELHNTNRGLLFFPSHAGWLTGKKEKKSGIVASAIGASHHQAMYHECDDLVEREFDVVLALANDHSIRETLTHLNAAVSFQATTGENWLSQLHRHILGRDGCIWCRTGEVKTPVFGCSTTVTVAPDGTKADAALPFLSAASGLMLVTALQRLSSGDIGAIAENCWSWDFGSEFRMAGRPAFRHCREGCLLRPSRSNQLRLVAGTRWASLVES